ncbi:hypothetical protein DYB38_006960 [Aphanomyces astaci]|uniref:Uncharacterized protein n=1 Tax=Aphanomyces astaci TaxID=112090 RepID=A0A397D3V6_APHAT|nr:hypothetical protein DYB38_006960 [Aphanomyces astaci]
MASTGGIQYLITTVAAAALRLFDASVAVATFNLFSDEPIALTRKVRDSMQLMQSFNVSLELPHHCHHTILAGGFHFGVGKIPHQTLVNRIETAYLAQGHWKLPRLRDDDRAVPCPHLPRVVASTTTTTTMMTWTTSSWT